MPTIVVARGIVLSPLMMPGCSGGWSTTWTGNQLILASETTLWAATLSNLHADFLSIMAGPVLIFSSPRDVVTLENTNVDLSCAGKSLKIDLKDRGSWEIFHKNKYLIRSALCVKIQVFFLPWNYSFRALFKAMTTFNFPPPEITWWWVHLFNFFV